MRLTDRTDFALRLLMYLAGSSAERVPVGSIARVYGVSSAHLAKVSQALVRGGFVLTVGGRSGGVSLARPAAEITVGEVVRALEPMEAVECFRGDGACPVTGVCALRSAMTQANAAFLAVLDKLTVAQVARKRGFAEWMRQAAPRAR